MLLLLPQVCLVRPGLMFRGWGVLQTHLGRQHTTGWLRQLMAPWMVYGGANKG